MALSWMTLLFPAVLIVVYFAPPAQTAEAVKVDCSKNPKNDEPCPSYCPQSSRTFSPSFIWAIPCICCKHVAGNKTSNSTEDLLRNGVYQPKMIETEAKPTNATDESRKKLIDELDRLTKEKILPPEENIHWKTRVNLTKENLLTNDEKDLLIYLLLDCNVGWGSAYLLVDPLAGLKSKPAPPPSKFGKRSGFLGLPEISVDNLKAQLQNVVLSKVTKGNAPSSDEKTN